MTLIGSLTALLFYVFPILVLTLISTLVRNKYNGLSHIPGPPAAAYTKFWRLYNVFKGQSHLDAMALHKKYGKLVRIAPNVVSISDPNEISTIYTTKGDYVKSAFYPLQSIQWHKKPAFNVFSTVDEGEHRRMRRQLANAYTLESLLKMEPAIDGCTKLFMGKLRDFADKKEPMDLGEWLQFYAFDVVGEVTFDTKLGFLEQGSDIDGMMETIEGILAYSAICGQIPDMHKYLLGNPLLPMLFPDMENWNQVTVFTLKAINTRTTMTKGGELEIQGQVGDDMLSKWAAVKSVDPDKMSTRDIVIALSTNVFAGSDTTAIALRAILYFLIKNPDKMAELQKEIDDATRAGQLSNPISDKEARGLPYLNAVEKEAIRMHSSVGLLLERHVPPSGATICGHFIPGGTIVGINPWVVQYDSEVFPDPMSFKPERWLEASSEHLAAMERSFLSFGAGTRVCTGKNISMIEMRKLIPQILREFDLSLENDGEWVVRNMWFTQQKMPRCILKRRSQVV